MRGMWSGGVGWGPRKHDANRSMSKVTKCPAPYLACKPITEMRPLRRSREFRHAPVQPTYETVVRTCADVNSLLFISKGAFLQNNNGSFTSASARITVGTGSCARLRCLET